MHCCSPYCALSLFAAAPAQAQTKVWSATLTVGTLTSNTLGCHNSVTGQECSLTNVLTDDDFTYDGVSYEITAIVLSATNSFSFGLNGSISETHRSALTLHVDSAQFALADDADLTSRSSVQWNNTGLNWSAGDTISLSLTTPPYSLTVDATPSCGLHGHRHVLAAVARSCAHARSGYGDNRRNRVSRGSRSMGRGGPRGSANRMIPAARHIQPPVSRLPNCDRISPVSGDLNSDSKTTPASRRDASGHSTPGTTTELLTPCRLRLLPVPLAVHPLAVVLRPQHPQTQPRILPAAEKTGKTLRVSTKPRGEKTGMRKKTGNLTNLSGSGME